MFSSYISCTSIIFLAPCTSSTSSKAVHIVPFQQVKKGVYLQQVEVKTFKVSIMISIGIYSMKACLETRYYVRYERKLSMRFRHANSNFRHGREHSFVDTQVSCRFYLLSIECVLFTSLCSSKVTSRYSTNYTNLLRTIMLKRNLGLFRLRSRHSSG